MIFAWQNNVRKINFMQPYTLCFSHANGFPASSYRAMFDALPSHANVIAIEKYAHSPKYPVSKDWQGQVNELMDFINSNEKQDIYLVGHSFGAVISYMAACQYPNRFKGLILLDPPVISGITAMGLKVFKMTGFYDHITPANKAATRCTSWPKGTNLVNYFTQKKLFKDMHPRCIEDYISSAISQSEDGYKLTFHHQVEAEIFRRFPLNLQRFYGSLSIPSLMLTGENSNVCTIRRIAPFVDKNSIQHEVFPHGSHMFPLEYPEQVAGRIDDQICQWQTSHDR